MKYGARKPSVKKSLSARTKGRATRTFKRTVSPFYGKKGVGWIRNPKKAAYNKIYHATTFSLVGLLSGKKKKKKDGPIITAISYIIVLCILGGIIESILPAVGSLLSNLFLLLACGACIYFLIMFLSSRPSGPTIDDLLVAERIKRNTDNISDDTQFYLGEYLEAEVIIALNNDKADIVDTTTGEVTSYNRIDDINNSFRLETEDTCLDFVVTENGDSIIMGEYDFDRIQKEDLKKFTEIIKNK